MIREVQIFDAYGRLVDLEALKHEQAAPTLAGLRNIYSVTHPSIGLTPERLSGVLRDAEIGDPYIYLELAEEMEEKDLHYNSVLSTRKHAIAALELTVQAASDSNEDTYTADFVRDVLLEGDLDLRSALSDILDAIGKGFSATEIIWDRSDWWIPSRLRWRDPRWFMFDWISGEEVLVRTLKTSGPELDSQLMTPRITRSGTGGKYGIQPATAPLAPFKFITHIAKAKSGLPIRGGIARLAAWVYLFKNYILKDWVGFAETYGQPLRVGKYGAGATEEDKTALLRAVANIGTDAAAIIPEKMLIEFVTNAGAQRASADLYEHFCDYIDRQMSKGILGQTLTTELPKGAGSRAAAEVHDLVRRDIATDDAGKLATTLTRDLVKPIVDLNLGPRAKYPQIKIGFPDEEDLERLAEALAPFIDRGLPVPQKAILEKFGLSEASEGEPLLHPVERVSGSDSSNPPPASATAAMSDGSRAPVVDRRDAIDLFVERLRDSSDEALAPMIRPLLEECRGARSYEDLRARMVRAVQEMDPSRFSEMLARAGFSINLAGTLGLRVSDPSASARRRVRDQTPRH